MTLPAELDERLICCHIKKCLIILGIYISKMYLSVFMHGSDTKRFQCVIEESNIADKGKFYMGSRVWIEAIL